MTRLVGATLLLVVLTAVVATAGHELPFYPSYYPQEIRIETHEPTAAAGLLRASRLHAYVGADPFPAGPLPTPLDAARSLGSYLVFTPAGSDDPCGVARRVLGAVAPPPAPYVYHPYPVTPYHADYLAHVDRIEAAKAEWARGTPTSGPALAVEAAGARAEALVRARWPAAAGPPAGRLEEVPVDGLLARSVSRLDGRSGPPWLKAGWYQAYLLQHGGLATSDRRAAEALYRRLTTGEYGGLAERLDLERALVARLGAGCRRVVVGYAPRREAYTTEFSEGIENVAADSQAGLNSAIFVRTAKLKDFPWNGWLRLGVPEPPRAAWNPIGGFTDPTGRLVWAALGDPAFMPAPAGAGWVDNRVTIASTAAATAVPADALRPEPATGRWREVGGGQAAGATTTYRVLASAFHDGSRMTPADTLYGLSFAYRWGTPGAAAHDPAVEAGSALLRDRLAGLRLLGAETTEREFGEVKFTSTIQTIQVWDRTPLAAAHEAPIALAPWSAVPWPLLALMEEAVTRRIAAFSADEARRLGIPWLDLARDVRLRRPLAALLDALADEPRIPAALAGQVTPAEARARWAALRDFYRASGHLLDTSGPYRLRSWEDGAVVLEVFRDLSYPLGVGSFDRYASPVRAYPRRVELRDGRVEVEADVEVVQKFQREHRIVRLPLRTTDVDARDMPVCHYVLVAPDGRVAAAGVVPYVGRGVFALDPPRLAAPGSYTLLLALAARDNQVDPEVRTVALKRD